MTEPKSSSKPGGSSRGRPPARHDAGGSDRSLAEGVAGLIDEVASNLPLGDTLARVVGTSERLTQAQAAAYSAVGLSSTQDIERLTLRVRTMFHRIDELEDELDDATRRMARLERELEQLRQLRDAASTPSPAPAAKRAASAPKPRKKAPAKKPPAKKP